MIDAPTAPAWLADATREFVAGMPQHFDRLGWSRDDLLRHQHERLRDLLHVAATGSPFHRRRLAGIDLAAVTPTDLTALPVMTKQDLMDRFDEVLTDRSLTRAIAEAHLRTVGEDPVLLHDRFLVLTSGGSSGQRGVYVLSRNDALGFVSAVLRGGMARLAAQMGWPPPRRVPIALVLAPRAIHATRAMSAMAAGVGRLTQLPATRPLEEIIAGLNEAQPLLLAAYASVLAQLADAAADGRLRIAPQMILSNGEQLTEELRERITAGFGLPPGNAFASSEGLIGSAPPGGEVVTFASDRAIVEFVDAADQPVAPGTRADHVLVTNLTNEVQPLIRYRLDDVMTEQRPEAGHGHQRATLHGRDDDSIRLGSVVVHPLSVRSVILRHPAVREHQVVVTPGSPPGDETVHLRLVASGPVAVSQIEQEVAAALRGAGAGSVRVTAAVVDRLERHPDTGKVRRVVTV